jgi:hypothetical protein
VYSKVTELPCSVLKKPSDVGVLSAVGKVGAAPKGPELPLAQAIEQEIGPLPLATEESRLTVKKI